MKTLVAKITEASTKVGALKADKTNKAQNYDYISADKILARVGSALAGVGVTVFPSITFEETAQVDYTDSYGKEKSRFDAVVHFAMIVTDGETQMELPWRGRGSDYAVPDKAMYKAITSGHKYFLAKLLNVGVGNEDGEHEEAEAAQPQATKAAPDVAFREPAKPRATKAQLEELDVLGLEFYRDEWEVQAAKLTEAISSGSTRDPKELLASEAKRLINGIKTKMAAVSNGVAA